MGTIQHTAFFLNRFLERNLLPCVPDHRLGQFGCGFKRGSLNIRCDETRGLTDSPRLLLDLPCSKGGLKLVGGGTKGSERWVIEATTMQTHSRHVLLVLAVECMGAGI